MEEKVFDLIKGKLFADIKKSFTKKELNIIDEKLNKVIIENQDMLDTSFNIDGYKHLYLNDNYKKGFQSRLLYNYSEPFSDFKIFNEYILSEGNDFITNEKRINNSKLFNALTLIFIKCNLIVKEIECLIENGFPNGAMARWRTLFEYNIIGNFLAIHGENMAERYLDFIDVERNKEIKEYKESLKYFDFEELEKNIIQENENKIKLLKTKYGDKFIDGDYGWANDFFEKKDKKKVSFKEILNDVDKNGMILYYKFSCSFIHSNCKNILINLASINGIKIDDYNKIIGNAVNIGFCEPIQLTMYCFLNAFLFLISINPSDKNIIYFLYLRNKIKKIATKCLNVEKKLTNIKINKN